MRNEYRIFVCKSREPAARERPRLIDAKLISKSILEKWSLRTEDWTGLNWTGLE